MKIDTLSLPHSKENPGKCQPDLLLVGPSHSLQGPSHKLYRTNPLKFTLKIRDLITHLYSQTEMLIWKQWRISIDPPSVHFLAVFGKIIFISVPSISETLKHPPQPSKNVPLVHSFA